jgi:paraquat-inducible protein B
VPDDHEFKLHDSYKEVLEQPYLHYAEYILLFNSSVAGLKIGAPVEYRGIQIGSVTDISMRYLGNDIQFDIKEAPIPVKIRIDPGRLNYEDSEAGVAAIQRNTSQRVANGIRASLATGSLLTGSRFVAFDYVDSAVPASIGQLGEYKTFPTVNRGFAQIEEQLSQFLNKLNKLEIEDSLESLDEVLIRFRDFTDSFKSTLANVDNLLTAESTQEIPVGLNKVLQQMERTLSGFDPSSPTARNFNALVIELRELSKGLADYAEILTNQPNALIFSGSNQPDPQPPQKSK